MLTMAIKQEANRLKMKYQTTDPYDICTSMDIQVIKRPMGASAQSCKGFFLVSSRCKLIVINSDLPESIQRIIIAHELGHAVLHSDSAISAFHEFAMFDDTDRMEYEANVFAAEFMLSDDEVMESLEMQMDFFQMARCLYVPPELLDFKLRILQRQGIKISAPEEIAFKYGWIDRETLLESASRYGKSPYGQHLKNVADGKLRY